MNDADFLKKIGENISRIRKEKCLTSKELGLQCDIEKSNLIPIEKGRINATLLTLKKIAEALNVEVKEFFS